MPFIIQRSFSPNYKSLLTRPRVSHKVSEYVFEFINDNLLKPSKVMQSDKYVYRLTFCFSFSIPKRTFPYTSPFATSTRLFFSQRGFRRFEKIEQWATMMVIANDMDQTIAPFEYATVVFKMFDDFLLKNYKKIDKQTLDALLLKLDRQYIEAFPFPASFEDQRYVLDHTEYPITPLEYGYEWADLDKLVTIDPRTEYLKHYKE